MLYHKRNIFFALQFVSNLWGEILYHGIIFHPVVLTTIEDPCNKLILTVEVAM